MHKDTKDAPLSKDAPLTIESFQLTIESFQRRVRNIEYPLQVPFYFF